MSNLLSEVHPELVAEWSERNLPLTPDKGQLFAAVEDCRYFLPKTQQIKFCEPYSARK